MGDAIAHDTRAVTVIAFQNPNCPMIFKKDPKKKHRGEDPQVAWSLKEYFDDPNHDPTLLILMPMAKASFKIMKAAQEFVNSK